MYTSRISKLEAFLKCQSSSKFRIIWPLRETKYVVFTCFFLLFFTCFTCFLHALKICIVAFKEVVAEPMANSHDFVAYATEKSAVPVEDDQSYVVGHMMEEVDGRLNYFMAWSTPRLLRLLRENSETFPVQVDLKGRFQSISNTMDF